VGVWGLVHDRSSRIHPLGPHHRRLPIDHRAFRAARPRTAGKPRAASGSARPGRGVGDGLSYPGAHVETEINMFL
jgi:hypothetical protein